MSKAETRKRTADRAAFMKAVNALNDLLDESTSASTSLDTGADAKGFKISVAFLSVREENGRIRSKHLHSDRFCFTK